MNNRFKFRVWDKENKKFLHYLSFDISSNGTLILFGGIEGKKYLDVNDTDRYVLMQSTGLKDKNGKLIYEGDIIRYTEYELDEVEPEWEYTEIVWGGNHDYPAFDLKVHEFDCNGLSYIFNEGWTIEIVNNIYEAKKIIDDCTKNC